MSPRRPGRLGRATPHPLLSLSLKFDLFVPLTLLSPTQVNYRETVRQRADFSYLHKKQSGGSGQYAKVMGFIAVVLASVNIFGGFIVTQRMLQMFRRKK